MRRLAPEWVNSNEARAQQATAAATPKARECAGQAAFQEEFATNAAFRVAAAVVF
jgi:hypothetical protein